MIREVKTNLTDKKNESLMIYKFTLLLGLLLFASLTPLFADDPPIMNGNDTSPKYNISVNTPMVVLPDFTITGNTTIRGLRISFSAGHHNDQDNLYFTYQNGISGSFNKSAGVLTLTGNASTAAYQAAVRSITYKNDLGLSANRDQREFTISLENNDYLATTGHFYEYVSTSVIWGGAISAAASRKYYGLQGYLCTISSYDENNIIYQKARGSYIWTSGTNDKISRWEWAAGPENGYGLSYTRWATGEPNNSSGIEHS